MEEKKLFKCDKCKKWIEDNEIIKTSYTQKPFLWMKGEAEEMLCKLCFEKKKQKG